MPPFPTTRAEISRSRLTGNFARLRALAQQAGSDLLAVVKADAYGHGASFCAPWLVEAGATWLGVTSAQEGVGVRKLCPHTRILLMSGLQAQDAVSLLDTGLAATVWDREHLDILTELVEQHSLPAGSLPIHLEIDTGMSRQGVSFTAPELRAFLDRLRAISAVRLEGVFTHYASPEMLDSGQNSQQTARFQQAVAQVATAGFRPRWIHAGNSSTLLGQRQAKALIELANSVGAEFLFRPGIALYGYALPLCGGEITEMPFDLEPVMTWKTAIASLRTIEAGAQVGYNGTFMAPGRMRLALLPIGYADGLNRKLSNRGHVLIRGTVAPIVGRISMDLTMVDVSHAPETAVGDEVVILGEQNGQRVTADDHARWAETISYEILCAVSARVPRHACE